MNKNQKTMLWVIAIPIIMTGMSFAAVPLYEKFCAVTGFDGTPQIGGTAPDEVLDRTVRVYFNADIAQDFNWTFKPEDHMQEVHIGAQNLTAYEARNNTNQVLTGTAIYNISPPKAAKYFHKTECFCFGEQTLNPKQDVNMPVVFYIDPGFAEDPNMDPVTSITLSYTFYKTETKELEDAIEDFYNSPE